MNLTSIIRPVFSSRLRELDCYATQAQQLQLNVLKRLLSKASDTQWGHQHAYSKTLSYEKFVQQTPVNTYEDLKGYIASLVLLTFVLFGSEPSPMYETASFLP